MRVPLWIASLRPGAGRLRHGRRHARRPAAADAHRAVFHRGERRRPEELQLARPRWRPVRRPRSRADRFLRPLDRRRRAARSPSRPLSTGRSRRRLPHRHRRPRLPGLPQGVQPTTSASSATTPPATQGPDPGRLHALRGPGAAVRPVVGRPRRRARKPRIRRVRLRRHRQHRRPARRSGGSAAPAAMTPPDAARRETVINKYRQACRHPRPRTPRPMAPSRPL